MSGNSEKQNGAASSAGGTKSHDKANLSLAKYFRNKGGTKNPPVKESPSQNCPPKTELVTKFYKEIS